MTTKEDTTIATGQFGVYLIRHADDNLVLGQRLAEYVTRAPDLEEELAVANIALDHIGLATHLFTYAATLVDGDTSADDLAMLRSEREYTNVLLVEQPHDGFGDVMVRQFLFDAYQLLLWQALSTSGDSTLSGIAQRAEREATYHLRHSSNWLIRLGDGTSESHSRMQQSINRMWRFTGELFESDELDVAVAASGVGADPVELEGAWRACVADVIDEATLSIPEDPYQASGGRSGIHTEHLGPMLAEMQSLARSYPGLSW